ncbi:MAG: YHS domain-containing protein [Bacteroidota bacterium]
MRNGNYPAKRDQSRKTDYKGKTYYFCSTSCKDKFIQAPVKYVKKDDNQSGHHH